MTRNWSIEELNHFRATGDYPEWHSHGICERPCEPSDTSEASAHLKSARTQGRARQGGPEARQGGNAESHVNLDGPFETVCEFRLPIKVPSVNGLYADVPVRSKGGNIRACFKGVWAPAVIMRVLTDKGRAFKKAVKGHLFVMRLPKVPADVELRVTLTFEGAWWNKTKGSKTRIKRRDVANYEKALLDSIGPLLGFDDSQVFDIRMRKRPADKEAVCVKIEKLA